MKAQAASRVLQRQGDDCGVRFSGSNSQLWCGCRVRATTWRKTHGPTCAPGVSSTLFWIRHVGVPLQWQQRSWHSLLTSLACHKVSCFAWSLVVATSFCVRGGIDSLDNLLLDEQQVVVCICSPMVGSNPACRVGRRTGVSRVSSALAILHIVFGGGWQVMHLEVVRSTEMSLQSVVVFARCRVVATSFLYKLL